MVMALVLRSSRKKIEKNIQLYREIRSDQRAEILVFIWALHGFNLSILSGNPEINIPIYYYLDGATSPLTDVVKTFQDTNKGSLNLAAHHHFYTNLAVSYPNKGFGTLVREMWDTILSDVTDLATVMAHNAPILELPQFKEMVANSDVSADEFLRDPKSIMPHFMVPGHPLSVRLLEDDKLGKSILGE